MLRTSQVREICKEMYFVSTGSSPSKKLTLAGHNIVHSMQFSTTTQKLKLKWRDQKLPLHITLLIQLSAMILLCSDIKVNMPLVTNQNKNAFILLPRHFMAFYGCIEITILSFIWKQTLQYHKVSGQILTQGQQYHYSKNLILTQLNHTYALLK